MSLKSIVGGNGLAVPLQTAESVCSLSENAGGTAESVFLDFVLLIRTESFYFVINFKEIYYETTA